MDGVRELLEEIRRKGYAQGNFLGVLHVLVGRRIARDDGKVVSAGLTWRMAASWLKKVRWPPESARELGLDPNVLPPRDRERFWYLAISQAGLDSPAARQAGDRFAHALEQSGYRVTGTS